MTPAQRERAHQLFEEILDIATNVDVLPERSHFGIVGPSVYAIQVDTHGPIKIGTTRGIGDRIRALQTGVPWPVRLIGQWPGDESVENRAHEICRKHALRNEWFHNHSFVRYFVLQSNARQRQWEP